MEQKKSYEIDMCNGPILSKMLLFTIPLMCSSMLQLLFNAADIVVLGVYAGSVPVCHVRLFYLQRHARRALPAGGHPIGDPLPANAVVSSAESICRTAAGFQFHAGGADA